MTAVSQSGTSVMSDSLIAFQPAIDEPSNIVPLVRKSSSTMERSKVTCCHLPRGSVNRKSTNLTSLALIMERTDAAFAMNVPFNVWTWVRLRAKPWPTSDGVGSGFARSDADGFFDIEDENLSVADASGSRSLLDCFDARLEPFLCDDDFDFHLRQEVHDVFRAAIEFGVT